MKINMLLLQVVFVILKLTEVVSWSWAIIFIPTWIMLGMVIIMFSFVVLFGLATAVFKR